MKTTKEKHQAVEPKNYEGVITPVEMLVIGIAFAIFLTVIALSIVGAISIIVWITP